MKNPEFIVMINTLLLSLMGLCLSVLSFFLKDVYRDYKKLSERVHTLHREASTNMRLFYELIQASQKQSEHHRRQIEQLQRDQARTAARLPSEEPGDPR